MFHQNFQIAVTLLIGIISITGDKLVEYEENLILRAVSDNLTHGLVAGLSWTLIVILSKESVALNILNIVVCSVLSSLIDLDHFIEAHSWKLNVS